MMLSTTKLRLSTLLEKTCHEDNGSCEGSLREPWTSATMSSRQTMRASSLDASTNRTRTLSAVDAAWRVLLEEPLRGLYDAASWVSREAVVHGHR